jgi:nucleoside-diphosphate-sugar epimerase
MASRPGIEVIGFLDDDPHKIGCVIAGTRVLGPTTLLPELVRAKQIDDLLVCIAPNTTSSFTRLKGLLETLPIRSLFVPTMEEILDAKDSLRVTVGTNGLGGGANGAREETKSSAHVPEFPPIRNMTILITGGAGFIGSSLATRLADDNEVILFDRTFKDQPVSFTPLLKHANVRLVEADIMNGHGLHRWAQEVDMVVHAAAIVGVGRVCSHPRQTLETNFVGTSGVLRSFEGSPRLKRFIYFSTSEVFGVNSFRVSENAPSTVGPAAEARWSYAIAKLAGEHLVKSYHREAGMPTVTVRPFNIFGPRRIGAHGILQFVLSCLKGTNIEVHGDGSQIRSWCYIEDFCDALIEMLRRPEAVGQDFNIGNPLNTLTIYQLAQKVLEFTGASVPIAFTQYPFPDIEIRVPSLDKARNLLGYNPTYDLDRGLRLTVDWYREHLAFFERRVGPSPKPEKKLWVPALGKGALPHERTTVLSGHH